MASILRTIVLAGVVGGLATGVATAQTSGEPAPGVGDRIRIRTLAGSSVTTGKLLAADADTITLAPEGRDTGRLSFARSEIDRLDLFRGRKSHWLVGAIVGAGAGFAAGVGFCGDGFCTADDGSDDTAKNAAVAAGIGGVVGGLFGLLIKSDRWTTVPADRVRVAVAPVRARGVALSVSVSF